MEKSIENIWKEGFLKDNDLVAPKVNDLYNRKSDDLIDKMMKMMRINIIGIWLAAFAFFAYVLFTGMPVALGLFLFLLFATVAIYSKLLMKKAPHLDRNVNSYQYLTQFDSWLKDALSRNTQLARYFYPLCFLAASLMIWYSEGRQELQEKLLEKYPDLLMIGNVPLYAILGLSLALLIVGLFSDRIYKWDVGLVYGRVFRKLEEILADMEELRK